MSEETAVAVVNPVSSGIDAADQLGDWMAKSGMFGCKSMEMGKVMAMTCVVEKITPMEFAQTYHIVDGMPHMKSDAMRAKFQRHGGVYEIKEWTDEACTIAFTWKDVTNSYTFTMADAKKAGLIRKGSQWEKGPKDMLLARCSAKGLRAYVPELFAGCYLADEIRDDVPAAPASAPSEPLLTKPPVDTEPSKHSDPVTIEGEVVEPEKEQPKLSAIFKKEGIKFGNAVGLLLKVGWVAEDDIKGVPAGAVIDGLEDSKKEQILKTLSGFKEKCEAVAE